MSESTESTQPVQPVKVKRPSHWRGRLLTALIIIILLALSIYGGARAAINERETTQSNLINTQLREQFAYALVDINYGRYEAAQQRLQFIIQHDADYPGASQKLTEVLVAMSVPTATSTPLPTPTPNPTGAEGIFNQAQQLISAGDWANALVAIDAVRKADPNYRTGAVDGMYYFTLRNYGYYMITQQGNLEGGIYELTLAERFGPLDNTATGLREGARYYITAASFWDINWEQAVYYLSQVASGWPSLWDGTMTAAQRLYYASMRYGDQLVTQGQYCDAVKNYEAASAIGALDEQAAKGYNQAYQNCYAATETVTPSGVIIIPTDTPGGPAETPTKKPKKTPTTEPTIEPTLPPTDPPTEPATAPPP